MQGAGGGGGRGGAHVVCGLKLGTLGDEVLEAVELAFESRPHEGRPAVLRRRGGGATRGERRRRGAGQQGRRAARAEGEGCRGLEGAAGGAALTLSVASSLAPLATRCSRQSSLPLRAAHMRAVLPSCGGAAAAPHAVSGGGEARGSRGGGRRGRRARGGGGWGGGGRGGAHLVCGLKLGTLGDEVLEAVELASDSRPHEGRPAVLRRRGGGATRGERRRRGAGQQGRRAARAEGEGRRGLEGATGGAALTLCVASSLAPLVTRCSRQSSLPSRAAHMRAVVPFCGGAAAAPHAVSGGGEARGSRGGGRRGRRARGGGGWGGGGRGGAHVVFGLEVHPRLHEALEGGEVAVHRRIEKSLLLRLRAQPSALSASQERGCGPR